MKKVYNFCAGPAALPEKVLKEAQEEFLNFSNLGYSVLEASHRSPEFDRILAEAESDLRALAGIPKNYKVLFLQGGASLQFSMVPMNLLRKKAGYLLTGRWAELAYKEAKKYGEAVVLASSAEENYSCLPDYSNLSVDGLDYVHICENNTIYGTQFKKLPETGAVPLVADASSCFLSAPVEIKKYGLLYAGAQKNLGPAGLTVVIIREDLLSENVPSFVPTLLNYKVQADFGSRYNTPNTFAVYLCGKVFKWLLAEGGLPAIFQKNQAKAKILYDFLDESRLFRGTACKKDRSLMNVPFVTQNPEMDEKFLAAAEEKGLANLRGHRTVGGMRASIYNAMPEEGVCALVNCMQAFEAKYGAR